MFDCEFCGAELKTQNVLNIHKAKTKACIELQIKKLGKPISEINKEKKAQEDAEKKSKKEAKKSKEEAKKIKETKKESKKEKEEAKEEPQKIVQTTFLETDDEESHTEHESEEEIDENAELPFSSSSEDETSDEVYKVEEPQFVKEVFNNIEEYQRTNPSRLNNLFKRTSTRVKTEIINDDQPPEVHKKKIEEYLPSKEVEKSSIVDDKILGKHKNEIQKEITKLIEDKFISFENKMMKTFETKMNYIIENIGKLEGGNDKKLKSIENKLERGTISIKDVERVIDTKLDDMFTITTKMLAEVESKSELLDIFRENMEDIIEKHYGLYKKFKYIKEDMEDMVYDKR